MNPWVCILSGIKPTFFGLMRLLTENQNFIRITTNQMEVLFTQMGASNNSRIFSVNTHAYRSSLLLNHMIDGHSLLTILTSFLIQPKLRVATGSLTGSFYLQQSRELAIEDKMDKNASFVCPPPVNQYVPSVKCSDYLEIYQSPSPTN